jgi:anti-sigma regulatory factor (Ser/Thr protein kinase)
MGAGELFDDYVGRRAAGARRGLVATVVVAVIVVGAVSTGLAVRQYRQAQHTALNDLRSRSVVAAAVVDAAFAGDVSALTAAAGSPSVVAADVASMSTYFHRLEAAKGALFNGGMGWVDRTGEVRVSTNRAAGAAPLNVADRTYFKQVLATGKPYVSAGLIGRSLGQPVVVIAVPTHAADGRVSGVLSASIRLQTVNSSRSELELGYAGLEIVDRNGRLILSRLARVRNVALLARVRREGTGVIASTHGLAGTGHDVVAYATATVPAWEIVIDRPRSGVFAAAWRSLELELGLVGAALVAVLGMVGFVVRRARRARGIQDARARAWSDLTRALAAASTPDEVAAALVKALSGAFPDAAAVVVFETVEGSHEVRTSDSRALRRVAGDPDALREVGRSAMAGRQTIQLERIPALAPVFVLSGRRLRAFHGLPMTVHGEAVGGLAVLRLSELALEESEWLLLASFAEQGAFALERSRQFEHDHDLARRLQRSLLPEALPTVAGVELSARYRAGGPGLEVGGDWYDAVRRADGILQLCIGDVIGRGVGAATLMGRHRNAFRAYAYECVSPAEIMRRMLRHLDDDELMITVACVSFDPYTGELAYACAGHPPPLLIADASRTVVKLEHAGSPPLGVAEPRAIREAKLTVGEPSTLVLYSDGLIERRGQNIERGIDLLGRVVADGPGRSIAELIERVTGALGPETDDVAVLVARLALEPVPFEVELPSDPSALPVVRGRLRTWLARRGIAPAEAAEILLAVGEACNNAVEHAYPDDLGTIRLFVDEDGETLRATVGDHGSWREGASGSERGRGIAIMRALMQTAQIETSSAGTEVVLERRLHGADLGAPAHV